MSLEDLAHAVRERRRVLGVDQSDVRERGGPNPATLTRIEQGSERQPYASTYRKLDMALGWRAGTAQYLAEVGPISELWARPTLDLIDQIRELCDEVERRIVNHEVNHLAG